VEWAIFSVEECLSKDFGMSVVFVDQKEIAYISGHFQTNGIRT
jgi:hypothetical protein